MIIAIQSWLAYSFRCVPSTCTSSSFKLLDGRKICVIFVLVAVLTAFAGRVAFL
jgi:hypothetical protein